MKVRLKTLLNKPRGGAWPSSARAVRCPVSQATSETCTYNCQQLNFRTGHIVRTALETRRKVQATIGLYAPNPLGYTRATMVGTMGYNSERRS